VDGRFLEPLASDNANDPVLRIIRATQPAAGADWTQTVPGQSTWALVSVCAQLVTSSAVANRVPVLKVTDGTNTIAQIPEPVSLTASLTTTVTWMADGATTSTAITGASVIVNTPKLILPPGFVLSSVTSLIDTGDQWQNVNVTVVEVLTGDVALEARLLEHLIQKVEALQPNSLVPGL
jgi:hypothetical protein